MNYVEHSFLYIGQMYPLANSEAFLLLLLRQEVILVFCVPFIYSGFHRQSKIAVLCFSSSIIIIK